MKRCACVYGVCMVCDVHVMCMYMYTYVQYVGTYVRTYIHVCVCVHLCL